MPAITTHTGDDGTTGMLGPNRVPKDDIRIEVLGALDEAQSALGLARAHAQPAAAERLLDIQRALYTLMGEISTSGQPDGEKLARDYGMWTQTAQTDALEAEIVAWRDSVAAGFIIPGASQFDGAIHLGRALVRRAERRVVSLAAAGMLANPETQRYLNRLSDWLYIFAQRELAAAPVTARTTPKRRRTKAAPET